MKTAQCQHMRLVCGRYTPLPALWPHADCLPPLRERVISLFGFLATEYQAIAAAWQCDRYVVTSTTFPFVADEAFIRQSGALNALKQFAGRAPEVLTTAYECAGWGYSLRYVASQCNGVSLRVALQIVDINVFEVARWNRSDLWGSSGFGVTTLVLELGPADSTLTLRQLRKTLALNGLVREVKAFVATHHPDAVALPFFPPDTAQLVRPPLADVPLLANMHGDFGHCFGSDPWIAVLRSQHQWRGASVAVVSLALNGYLAVGLVETGVATTASEVAA